jgi:hypothetical protein
MQIAMQNWIGRVGTAMDRELIGLETHSQDKSKVTAVGSID